MLASFYTKNRNALKSLIGRAPIVIAAHDEVHRRADAAFAFVQESNFFYLTGINEAGWKLVITDDRELLVSPGRSEVQTLFEGSLTDDDARNISGVETIIAPPDWKALLDTLQKEHTQVATIGRDPHQKYNSFAPNAGPENTRLLLEKNFKEVIDAQPALAKLRAIKQPEEIAAMRLAIKSTVDAFAGVKAELGGFKTEAQVGARLTHDFLVEGFAGHAYDPIVAGGANACTLHYVKNNAVLVDGELLLIDAGAIHGEYAADITRTYAIGKVGDRHRQVHSAVEKAHHEIIRLIKPGLGLKEYSDAVDGIMQGVVEELGLHKSADSYRKYFPHAISHGLGLDVHESLGGYKEFLPGMTLTVEPGIYIPEEAIGARIEDDILVTADGNENLSADLPTSL